MSKRDKLRRKLKNNSKGVKFSELETLLLAFGFSIDRIRGSHHAFVDDEKQLTIVIPKHGNNVNAHYVKEAIEILDRLFPEDKSTEAGETDE